jgi:hypothetical protein
MNIPLVIDEKDKKWILVGNILDIVTARRVKQEMAKQGIHPVRMAGVIFKIVLIAMFYSAEISYVVEELKRRRELRCFAHVGELPEAPPIYRFLSRCTEEQFVGFVSGALNAICAERGRSGALVVDSTNLSLDLNWFRRRIRKADLTEREYDGGWLFTNKRLLYRV